MAPIGIGFIGLSANGWAASKLAVPLLEEPLSNLYRLVAVSTTNAESAAASAKKYTEVTGHPVKAYHGSAEAISNDPDVQLVVISVKTPAHREAALAAIRAGKDVFIEWPLAGTLSAAQEIADAAKQKGVRTFIGLQGRQSPVVREVKSIVESGRLGRILSTTVSSTTPVFIHSWGPNILESTTYTAPARSGASYFDITGGHFVDPFEFAVGKIASISATTAIHFPTGQVIDGAGKPTGRTVQNHNPDQIAVSGTLANGAVYSFHFRFGVEGRAAKTVKPLVWTIDFEQGSIRIESDDPIGSFINVTEPRLFVDGEEVTPPQSEKADNLHRAWAEYAKGESGDYPTIDDGLRLRRLMDAVFDSADTGKRIDFKE